MSFKGLASIKARQEEQERQAEERNRPKAGYFKWPKGVTKATIRPLQELDESATNYDPEKGIGFVAVEHNAPGEQGYQRRANCTLESEGRCYPCEQRKLETDKDISYAWRQRQSLYLNVAYVFAGETEVQYGVLSRTFNSLFARKMFDYAINDNTITDKNFSVEKSGTGTSTIWLPLPDSSKPLDISKTEVFDLETTVLRDIPYEDQAAYYGQVWNPAPRAITEESESTTTAVDEDTW